MELPVKVGNQLIARSPMELEKAHDVLLDWCEGRIAEAKQALKQEEEALEIAQSKHWNLRGIKSRIRREKGLVLFYGKIKQAVEAGYFLVPNFAMDVFAIRTSKARPRGGVHVSRGSWARAGSFPQNAERLPLGEGEYQSPDPAVASETDKEKNEKGELVKVVESWPDEWAPPDFPFQLATPAVMTKTGEAMALKLFDEVGIARDEWDTGNRSDPMILGRLRDPRPNRIGVTFFIAWGLDLRSL